MQKRTAGPFGSEIILRTKDLRQRIADIMSPQSGRRVAVVAFVGRDALKFAPEPKGLEVYCWPNSVATNPDGIRALLNQGASVYFVDRLHIKAYWSEHAGCLIGSPNLSANALDEEKTGLHEIGWFSPDSSVLDIDALIHRLQKAGAYQVDETALLKLERAYKPATTTKPQNLSEAISFNSFLDAAYSKRFRCVSWASSWPNSRAEIDAAADYYEDATGRQSRTNVIEDSIEVDQGTKDNSWILACKRKKDNSIGKLTWLFAHHVAKPRSNARFDSAMTIRGLYVPEPPFDIFSDNFHNRFSNYAKKFLHDEFDTLFNKKQFKRFEVSFS